MISMVRGKVTRSILTSSATSSWMCSDRKSASDLRAKVRICLTMALPRSAASMIVCSVAWAGRMLLQLAGQDRGMAADDRDDVVEIVGDAAGQGAQAFQLLVLAHLGFQDAVLFFAAPALGNVFQGDHPHHPSLEGDQSCSGFRPGTGNRPGA